MGRPCFFGHSEQKAREHDESKDTAARDATMVRIAGFNGMIKETDPESGAPLVPSSSSSSSSSSSTSTSSTDQGGSNGSTVEQIRAWVMSETSLFGKKVPTYAIMLAFVLGYVVLGQVGLIFMVLIVGIGYHLVGAPSSASSSSSGPGGRPPRGRANIRGIGDLPKPPPKC